MTRNVRVRAQRPAPAAIHAQKARRDPACRQEAQPMAAAAMTAAVIWKTTLSASRRAEPGSTAIRMAMAPQTSAAAAKGHDPRVPASGDDAAVGRRRAKQ